MNLSHLAVAMSIGSLAAALPYEASLAHTMASSLGAMDIAKAIKGRICVAKSGARFSFGADGAYRYDGLWQSSGTYTINPGSITITFESGLSRDFAIAVRDGAFIIEETVIFCSAAG